MQILKDFINTTGFKIAILFALSFLTLFALLNFIVLQSSQETFVAVLEGVDSDNATNSTVQDTYGQNWNILRFRLDGTERVQPLEAEFTSRFQSSLLSVAIIAVISSFIIGFAVSQIFTRPLRQLSKGMRTLRENNYQVMLEGTGTEEFDEVIYEFNKLTEQLQQLEVLRKDLISDTSHELKTPIASLAGQLQGINDGVLKPNEKRISDLLEQVNRLNELVDKLQDFARLQGENLNLKKKKVKLKQVLDTVKNTVNQDLLSQNVILNIKIKDKFTLTGDKNGIERVFLNLIGNAIKYSSGTEIKIYNKKNTIFVEDNGVGINKDSLPYIFERFYRVEKSRNRNTGGLGLGLAIVKEIVEAHGWQIDVESEEGKGTTFILKT